MFRRKNGERIIWCGGFILLGIGSFQGMIV